MASQVRLLKIFCQSHDLQLDKNKVTLIEAYQNFQLVSVTSQALVSRHILLPYHDITDSYFIRLARNTIDTSQPRHGEQGIVHLHDAYLGEHHLDKKNHHYLLQFIGPIKQSWLASVAACGAKIRSPIQGFTYIVCATQAQINRIICLRTVRWIGHYRTEDRIFIESSHNVLPRTQFFNGMYRLSFYSKREYQAGIKKISKQMIQSKYAAGFSCVVQIDAPQKNAMYKIKRLAKIHGIRAIRAVSLKRTSMHVATRIIQGQYFSEPECGIDGSGETVAVCDTGFDSGKMSTIHPDFKGRISALKCFPISSFYRELINNETFGGTISDIDSGHGTHVAGLAVGDGSSSIEQQLPQVIRGLAYKANLVFQSVEHKLEWKSAQNLSKYGQYVLAGIPDNISDLFNHAYKFKARIHVNSWGGGGPGEYDDWSWQVDDFCWRKKDFCIVVAAGNDGSDPDGNGVINATSITAPATSKNCITVGASENYQPQFNANRYGSWWPNDYPVAPYQNAPLANSKKQVAAFSGRGPTLDGRIKPDIVAPGTYILATRSKMIAGDHAGWAEYPDSVDYFYLGGTSMATPIVAGAVACIRQYLRSWIGFKKPSAALLKACTIMSSHKLPRYSSARALADNQQGFGLLDLKSLLHPSDNRIIYYYDDSIGLKTGEFDEYAYRVTSSSSFLKLVLVYSDYPGENLVNNLNLLLIDPDCRRYTGNISKSASRKLEFDSINNVEVINVTRPKKGRWIFQVIAANVPQGPQDYALIVNGNVLEL